MSDSAALTVGVERPVALDQPVGGEEGVLLQQIVDAQRRSGALAPDRDPLPVLLEQRDDAGGGVERLVGGLGDAIEEEFEPGFPGSVLADLLEQPVIVGAMRLEIEAEVEQRLVAARHGRRGRASPASGRCGRCRQGTDGSSRTGHGAARP